MSFESSAGGSRTITAFFDDRSEADRAVSRLTAAGISQDRIRLVAGQDPSSAGTSGGSYSSGTSGSGYSSGQEGGFWDSLKDLFMPDEDRYTYAEGLRRGGYLVTVQADSSSYERALDILDDEGTIDIGEREASWRSEGWAGYTGGSGMGGTAGYSGTSGTSGAGSTGLTGSGTSGLSGAASTGFSGSTDRMGSGTEEVIPIAEEELHVGKRDVSHGRVRVRSYVVETPVNESVSLREERVNVERRPVDRALSGNEALFQDRTIELEERGEEAVVAKEARVREELVINKEVDTRTETISDTVRRTEVDVEDDRSLRTGTDDLSRRR